MLFPRTPPALWCGLAIFAAFWAQPCLAVEDGLALLAHAVDANAAVFRLSDGRQVRVNGGQAVANSGLILERVAEVGVVLRAQDNLLGHPLRWQLRDNESISKHQLEVVRESQTSRPTQPVATQSATSPRTPKQR